MNRTRGLALLGAATVVLACADCSTAPTEPPVIGFWTFKSMNGDTVLPIALSDSSGVRTYLAGAALTIDVRIFSFERNFERTGGGFRDSVIAGTYVRQGSALEFSTDGGVSFAGTLVGRDTIRFVDPSGTVYVWQRIKQL